MIGNWRWNAGFGLFGLLLTIGFSLGRNPISVVLLRSIYALVAFFIIAYAVRAVLAYVLRPPALIADESGNEHRGASLDLRTPDEADDLNELLKTSMTGDAETSIHASAQQQAASEFQPLNPPKLVSVQDKQPEELAHAIRHLTGG